MASVLTPKEQRILRLRYSGMANADIAKKLNVSPADISQTFKRISKKLRSVGDTLQLMREAGLIESAPPIKLTDKGLAVLEEVAEIVYTKPNLEEIMEGQENSSTLLQPIPDISNIGKITRWKNVFVVQRPVPIVDYDNMPTGINTAVT